VRLRYSVEWASPRVRITSCLRPIVETVLACSRAEDTGKVRFVALGVDRDRRFAWATLQGHIDELLGAKVPFEWVLAAANDLTFYRPPLPSIIMLIVWQVLCTRLELFPACLPVVALTALTRSYAAARERPALHRPPALCNTWKALLLPGSLGKPHGLRYTPAAEVTSQIQSGAPPLSDSTGAVQVSLPGTRAPHADGMAAEEVQASAARSRPPLSQAVEQELRRAREQPVEVIVAGGAPGGVPCLPAEPVARSRISPLGSVAKGAAGAAGAAAGLASQSARAIINVELDDLTLNPLAPYLGPLQRMLGEQLVYVRVLASIYRWDDTVLTGWVCVALVTLAALLPFVPWLLLLRLSGIGLFGPQNYVLDRWRTRKVADEAAAERRYQQAGDVEAREIVAERVRIARAELTAEEERTSAASAEAERRRPLAEREQLEARRRALELAPHTLHLGAMPRFPRAPARPELNASWARPAADASESISDGEAGLVDLRVAGAMSSASPSTAAHEMV
jgi:hypothetical protein